MRQCAGKNNPRNPAEVVDAEHLGFGSTAPSVEECFGCRQGISRGIVEVGQAFFAARLEVKEHLLLDGSAGELLDCLGVGSALEPVTPDRLRSIRSVY